MIEKGNHHQMNIFIKTFIINPMDKRNSHLTSNTIAITVDDPNISRGDCHCLMKESTLMNKDSTSTLCLGIKATTKTVKVERDPSISDIIEQYLMFHQRCDNIDHMLGQLLERSRMHPLTIFRFSISLFKDNTFSSID